VVSKRTAALDAMIEAAIVDAYNDDEQLTGLYTRLEEHLAVPYRVPALGRAVSPP
jgi:hypothetical protein